jgi:hypothetical protein
LTLEALDTYVTKNMETPMGPNPSNILPAGNRIIPYETPSRTFRSSPRKTAGSARNERHRRLLQKLGFAAVFAFDRLLSKARRKRFPSDLVRRVSGRGTESGPDRLAPMYVGRLALVRRGVISVGSTEDMCIRFRGCGVFCYAREAPPEVGGVSSSLLADGVVIIISGIVFAGSERIGETSRDGCADDGLLWRRSCKVRLEGPAILYADLGGDEFFV